MKKFMIRSDIEGVSGVVSYEQADPSQAEFPIGQKWFMSDLMALINGLRDGGADEIHIYDEHFYGRNIDLDAVGEKVFSYCGKPPYRDNWAGGLDESFDGLILLGFHSMRDTFDALLNHSYEPDIKAIRINGVPVGEIGVEAAIAGQFDVPLAIVTGDSEGIREAKELVPGTVGVTVKESLSEFGALCYPVTETYKWIYNAAKDLAENGTKALPYKCGDGPVKFEFEFFDTQYAKLYRKMFGEPVIVRNTALECWAEYWKNKLEVQKLL